MKNNNINKIETGYKNIIAEKIGNIKYFKDGLRLAKSFNVEGFKEDAYKIVNKNNYKDSCYIIIQITKNLKNNIRVLDDDNDIRTMEDINDNDLKIIKKLLKEVKPSILKDYIINNDINGLLSLDKDKIKLKTLNIKGIHIPNLTQYV